MPENRPAGTVRDDSPAPSPQHGSLRAKRHYNAKPKEQGSVVYDLRVDMLKAASLTTTP